MTRKSPLPVPSLMTPPALGNRVADLVQDIQRHYNFTLGRETTVEFSAYSLYTALALTLRDRLMERWKATIQAKNAADGKSAYYLSMEFLLGRSLDNALLNLGLGAACCEALDQLGLRMEDITDQERDAGLGNGGLGRLAACFLDSCATLGLPVLGYGLRYEYGMFRQILRDGAQLEEPDHWLRDGYPWEIERPDRTVRVCFCGRSESFRDFDGHTRRRWVETRDVLAVPYDIPVPGYENGVVNTLRLWKAAATDEFDLADFNAGDYAESVEAKNAAEHITMVLYPNDVSENGKALRLKQQYFLSSASLQDVLRRWVKTHGADFSGFAAKNVFQLNDTHPSIAVAELMRLLLDEQRLGWDEAWGITRSVMAYTNHTLLPEALERWPVRLFRQLLPRLLEIIHEINARHLGEVAARWPGDTGRLARMSLIEEGHDPHVRMAYLALVGSFSVNGVAQLHTDLLCQGLFRDFHDLWPEKFNNKTNGVTPRRWLEGCNPGLAALIDRACGPAWRQDIGQLAQLRPYAEDAAFRADWRAARQKNKTRLATWLKAELGVEVDAAMLFDVQVKRIHEYKRQLLNVLHVIHLYDRIKRGDVADWTPRCVLFGGKAAPGYVQAKRVIKLINNVARCVNADPVTRGLLQVVFVPDYRVSVMERICPATDLSEQISTAGKEASGTGNMKFMMNGALTIGTLDGANIEIRSAVGEENFFLFGLTAQEVEETRMRYDPLALIGADERLARVLHLLECGQFSRFEPGVFDSLLAGLKFPGDAWLTLADFASYVVAQDRAAAAFRDQESWTRMSILNTAASGGFSSDRTIAEYNRDIWKLARIA